MVLQIQIQAHLEGTIYRGTFGKQGWETKI